MLNRNKKAYEDTNLTSKGMYIDKQNIIFCTMVNYFNPSNKSVDLLYAIEIIIKLNKTIITISCSV